MVRNVPGPEKDTAKNNAEVVFGLPSIDKYTSRREWENACWHKILDSKRVLNLLAAPYERHNLVMRAAVAERLFLGKRYGEIAKELWLSPQTISSIKKSIAENNYRSYRDRGKSERKKREYHAGLVSSGPKRRGGRSIRTKYGRIHLPN